MRSASWTDEPPYFCTTRAKADLPGFAFCQLLAGSPVGTPSYRPGPGAYPMREASRTTSAVISSHASAAVP